MENRDSSILFCILEARADNIKLSKSELIDTEDKSFTGCVMRNFANRYYDNLKEPEIIAVIEDEKYFTPTGKSKTTFKPTEEAMKFFFRCNCK